MHAANHVAKPNSIKLILPRADRPESPISAATSRALRKEPIWVAAQLRNPSTGHCQLGAKGRVRQPKPQAVHRACYPLL